MTERVDLRRSSGRVPVDVSTQYALFDFGAAGTPRPAALGGRDPASVCSVANGTPLARRSDPITSHQAAAQAKDLQQRGHRLIVACLKKHGPLGKDGIAARCEMTGHAVGKRMKELETAGLARQTTRLVKSTAGRNEREWEAV